MKKIAFPTEDGETISPHLGRAPFFVVATIEEDNSVQFEKRSKAYHDQAEEHSLHEQNGTGLHGSMFAAIKDCQVLIAGGMGEPAYEHALSQGLEVFLPAEKNIRRAMEDYQAGSLTSDMRRIHKH